MRELLIAGRQMGKTTQLVERHQEAADSSIIVCHSAQEADRLTEQYGLDPRSVLPAYRFTNGSVLRTVAARNVQSALVDNLDLVLPQLLGVPVDFATMTRPIGGLYIYGSEARP